MRTPPNASKKLHWCKTLYRTNLSSFLYRGVSLIYFGRFELITFMVFQVLVQTTITLVPIGLVSGSVQKILCGCLIIVRWAAKCVLEYRVSQAFLKVVVVVTRLPWPNKWVPVLYNAIKGPKVNVTSSKKWQVMITITITIKMMMMVIVVIMTKMTMITVIEIVMIPVINGLMDA